MLKAAAAVLVIGGSTGLGIYYCLELKKRIRALQSVLQFLTMLQKEIIYNKLPLAEACGRIGERALEPYGGFFLGIQTQMRQYPGSSFAALWQSGLEKLEKETALQKEDMILLKGIADEQGFSDGSMQIQKIAFQIGEIEELIHKLKQNEENKSRIYLCMGIMSGILCTILFL